MPRYPAHIAFDQRLAARAAYVINTEQTTSTGWAELPTYGPVVILPAPPSGRVTLEWSAWARNLSGTNYTLAAPEVTREADNAVIHSPTDDYSAADVHGSGGYVTINGVLHLAGLEQGRLYRYRLRYRVGAGTGEFLRRYLVVRNDLA